MVKSNLTLPLNGFGYTDCILKLFGIFTSNSSFLELRISVLLIILA
jgi:hypothetical protein